ncbi:hypothetical protein fugu_000720 [Takifugu bimaculatus]|uniref:Phosphodiesterase n=1 Tax=Takifugu bimaculatus TaxID=433685 RepID=A0A4Z2CHR3_9TELE|nr:hypothetical protein fugu_000720 [Takifugu bimaculatus]
MSAGGQLLHTDVGCSWKPFDKSNYKQLLGAMDYSFLCAYAVGMYLSGIIGERLPIRLYLTVGMLASGLFTCLFGLGYIYNIHSLSFYIFVQVMNGLVQTTGWPSVVTCIGNWFGKGRRGLIMGLWNSHTSVGNILGSLIAGYWVSSNWGLSFIVPGIIIAGMGVACFLFLIEHPNDLKRMYLQSSSADKKSCDTELLLPRDAASVALQPVVVVRREAEPSPISFMGALRIPGVVEFSLCLLFAKLVSYTFLFWLPLYMTKAAHLDAKKAGDLSTLFDLYGFSRISRFGLGPTIAMLLVCGGLVNGPYALITTAVSADLGTHKSLKGNARALSTVTAIIDGTGSVGAALGPLLAGLLSAGGWNQVFYMLMTADFLALLTHQLGLISDTEPAAGPAQRHADAADTRADHGVRFVLVPGDLPGRGRPDSEAQINPGNEEQLEQLDPPQLRNTNLSLLDSSGAMVSIDPTMPHNTERSPYKLVPLAGGQLADKEELFQNVLTQVAEQFSRAFKINELKTEVTNRLAMLEKRVECNNFLDDSKKLTPRRDVPSYPKYMLSQQTIDALKKPTFDVWLWEANEMLSCLEHMYHDLGLVKDFSINPITLKRWLLCIHDNYKNNPFHNFRHCFCVTQMMYSMICLCSLQEKLSQLDILILMTAAVCHDLDHPGFNNT